MPSNADPKSIVLGGNPVRFSMVAAGPIKPGHLLRRLPAGTVIASNANDGNFVEKMFAVERDFTGISLDDEYAAGEIVPCVICRPGDHILAWIRQGVAMSHGSFLGSDASGNLRNANLLASGIFVGGVVAVGGEVISGAAIVPVRAKVIIV